MNAAFSAYGVLTISPPFVRSATLVNASELVIVMPGEERKLSDLLPHSFEPRDLGVTSGLLAPAANGLTPAGRGS